MKNNKQKRTRRPKAARKQATCFMRLDGKATSASDPRRGIWYGPCGYWTDNWSYLGSTKLDGVKVTMPGGVKVNAPGPPCCPKCGAVGFQGVWQEWMHGAELHEKKGSPNYVDFLLMNVRHCYADTHGGFVSAYKAWQSGGA